MQAEKGKCDLLGVILLVSMLVFLASLLHGCSEGVVTPKDAPAALCPSPVDSPEACAECVQAMVAGAQFTSVNQSAFGVEIRVWVPADSLR